LRERDGLQPSSAEAAVRSAEGRDGNGVAELHDSRRHPLPTRLVTGSQNTLSLFIPIILCDSLL